MLLVSDESELFARIDLREHSRVKSRPERSPFIAGANPYENQIATLRAMPERCNCARHSAMPMRIVAVGRTRRASARSRTGSAVVATNSAARPANRRAPPSRCSRCAHPASPTLIDQRERSECSAARGAARTRRVFPARREEPSTSSSHPAAATQGHRARPIATEARHEPEQQQAPRQPECGNHLDEEVVPSFHVVPRGRIAPDGLLEQDLIAICDVLWRPGHRDPDEHRHEPDADAGEHRDRRQPPAPCGLPGVDNGARPFQRNPRSKKKGINTTIGEIPHLS